MSQRITAVLAIAWLQLGCVLMMREDVQRLPVVSTPTGAEAIVDGHALGRTPKVLTLSRDSAHVIELRKEGHETQTVVVEPVLDRASLGYFVAGVVMWNVLELVSLSEPERFSGFEMDELRVSLQPEGLEAAQEPRLAAASLSRPGPVDPAPRAATDSPAVPPEPALPEETAPAPVTATPMSAAATPPRAVPTDAVITARADPATSSWPPLAESADAREATPMEADPVEPPQPDPTASAAGAADLVASEPAPPDGFEPATTAAPAVVAARSGDAPHREPEEDDAAGTALPLSTLSVETAPPEPAALPAVGAAPPAGSKTPAAGDLDTQTPRPTDVTGPVSQQHAAAWGRLAGRAFHCGIPDGALAAFQEAAFGHFRSNDTEEALSFAPTKEAYIDAFSDGASEQASHPETCDQAVSTFYYQWPGE